MTLATRVAASLSREVDPAVCAFARLLGEEAGALAVLFYGSNLRTGELDGVLDFYVLTGEAAERRLWPTVSYREWEHEGRTLRAKIATMTLAKFAGAARGETRDTTIWARFVQPSALVWSDGTGTSAVRESIASATVTASALAVALGPAKGSEDDYWRALFRATYRAEFRVEKAGREDSILSLNAAHFDGLLPAALDAAGIAYMRDGDAIMPQLTVHSRSRILGKWRRWRRWGKPLNIARLLRAARTFDGAGRYAAWKVERHTGVAVALTPWREAHPLLAAPGVLWRVWRQKRHDC
ncbi:MAG: hypothetical protein WBA68_10010 [Alteraurantiacibacter sp.]